jgi:hypothetical protein
MSSTGNTIHKPGEGETLDSLVAAYRLSSVAAILDTQCNASIRSILAKGGELPVDLIIHIPPNAEDILRRRLQELNQLKPVLLAHFDTQQELVIAELLPVLANDVSPFCSDEVSAVLQNLEEFSQNARDRIDASSTIFVELGSAMSLTHVATRDDHALASASGNPAFGLTWAVSNHGLSAWNSLWTRDVMESKWGSGSSDTDARNILALMMTIRSLVVQSVDRRIRESFSLQQKLQAEK